MILRPLHSPIPLIEAASIAAYDLHVAIRKMTIAELEEFAHHEPCFSLGVVCHVQTDEAGAFADADFSLSFAPVDDLCDAFHCLVPIFNGYKRSEDELTKAAENFWFARALTQRMQKYGRELAHLTKSELDLISRNRGSLFREDRSKSLNDALLVEVANKERELRDSESNHSRLPAITELEPTKIYLIEERKVALAWFERLQEHDRMFLPSCDCYNVDDEKRAIFTYRDYKEKVSRRRKGSAIGRYFDDRSTSDLG